MELHELTAHAARSLLDRREISAVELLRAVLNRIAAVESVVGAYTVVTPELAERQARAADERIGRGEAGPLTGIPVALKDLLCTAGVRTTCGSRMLADFVPPYSAAVVERLEGEGTVTLGKANMDEFAMGSSTEWSAFHPTRNPWDTSRVPGGSSGGSAAAVAADEALLALGSDTGGSIRQPAALCGVVGMKPTYGRVSRYGLIAFASSLDQIGPLTKDVEDCALLLQAISGHDARDATSVDRPVPDYRAALQPDLRGVRLGLPREYFVAGMHPGVEAAVRSVVERLVALGAEVADVTLPHTRHALATYYIIAPAEASANLARYDGVKYGHSAAAGTMWEGYSRTRGEGFGPEVKRRIMLGTYALSATYYDAYYLKAQKARTLIKEDFDRVFADFDAIVAPVTPTAAFPLGQKTGDPLAMYLNDACTIPVNMAGLPGISVPCGYIDHLPVGFQVIGPAFGEEMCLRVAYAYEQSGHSERRKPQLTAVGPGETGS
ncbi:MAG: Asp-tRNA(Asn)/Glu-tRNA(Gln) amidotransferase subunit GatA [Chloroflexota bacterium]